MPVRQLLVTLCCFTIRSLVFVQIVIEVYLVLHRKHSVRITRSSHLLLGRKGVIQCESYKHCIQFVRKLRFVNFSGCFRCSKRFVIRVLEIQENCIFNSGPKLLSKLKVYCSKSFYVTNISLRNCRKI